MRQGKFARKRSWHGNIKRIALPLALILLITIGSVGGTLAYILDNTGTVENTFTPARVSCEVNENLTVKSTSNVKAYLRAMVIVNWMDSNGNILGQTPNYTATTNSGWTLEDGIYYYKSPVDPNEVTTAAPAKVTCNEAAPEAGYKLTVQVVAEAIQAEGMGDDVDSAQDAWAAAKTRPTGNG